MSTSLVNFNPGPSILAPEVLEAASRGVLDLPGADLSILEISHRSKPFEEVIGLASERLRRLLAVPDTHEILFLQGGARGQMAQIPLSFAGPDTPVAVIDTGNWSKAAINEAAPLCKPYRVASTAEAGYTHLPDVSDLTFEPGTAYVHTTSNNTIYGTQWRTMPDFPGMKHVADLSSDILSRPVDVSRFGLLYAGAQKNAGAAGVTLVIVDKAWMAAAREDVPPIWQYRVLAKKDSMYNTPPTFAIYVVSLVLGWIEDQGGVAAMEARAQARADLLYGAIDGSGGFYRGYVTDPADRSHMNVTFRLATPELEARFVAEAGQAGMIGVKGHRIAGGIRASVYNQMPLSGVERLVDFMEAFRRRT